jgi:sugar phosphate isomerase/epimerase
LADEGERAAFSNAIESRGLLLSALSVHNNPLHPDPDVAQTADAELRNAIRLAEALGVPVVNGFSGLPAGAPGDTSPNWVTCPWPPDFLRMLDYQWNDVAIPYWREMERFAAGHNVKIAFEMHPGMLVYNVETLLRLRAATGPALGCNFDPSHLWWNGVEPAAAIRALGPAIFHVHGKDCFVDAHNVRVNGLQRPQVLRPHPGAGVDVPKHRLRPRRGRVARDLLSTLRLVGYDYVISIEHEDALMSTDEGLAKGIALLKEVTMLDPAGEMFWA